MTIMEGFLKGSILRATKKTKQKTSLIIQKVMITTVFY